jgi:5-formyltetrahydrofolate cyclo-ligase
MGGIRQPDDKARVRREMLARRLRVDAETLRAASRLVAGLVLDSEACRRARALASYAPARGEVDPGAIDDAVRLRGVPTYYPRVENGTLVFRRAERDELVAGTFGIAEPPAGAAALRDGSGALILVPGLAFDPSGARLGSGAGFYDRALPGMGNALTLGVALDLQMARDLPQDPWDVRMDGIVTERGIVWSHRPDEHRGDRA